MNLVGHQQTLVMKGKYIYQPLLLGSAKSSTSGTILDSDQIIRPHEAYAVGSRDRQCQMHLTGPENLKPLRSHYPANNIDQ